MLELVNEEDLPDFLGGKCKCAESGGCMNSVAGPWNDFELMRPYGVRHKVSGDFYNFERKMDSSETVSLTSVEFAHHTAET